MRITIKTENYLKQIPNNPGVYRFYDQYDNILYVGKAINLAKRVKSYFQKRENNSTRIALMISKIVTIEFTVTENEASALILENNLIKSLKPKYNIIFRDDKSYPLIRISKHKYPKIDYFRGKTNNNNNFFGPYPNVHAIKYSLDMIQRIFKLRTCTDQFFANRKSPCMLYQIKRCSAPCVEHITEIDYKMQVHLAQDFLNGKYNGIIDQLSHEMNECAKNDQFEQAALIRDKISVINQIRTNQIVTNHNKPLNADLLIYKTDLEKVFIYLIILRNGVYVGDNHFILDNVDNNYVNVIQVFIENYYLETRSTKQIITAVIFDREFQDFLLKSLNIKIISKIPNHITKLFEMGEANLKRVVNNYIGDKKLVRAAEILSQYLNTEKVERIECIDVSHNHGEDAVASLVVYENGIINNSKYRKYNLPREVNGNDLQAMENVLMRRLKNMDMKMPDVILVDGGRLQYDRVKKLISASSLCGKIRVAAIFKGERRDPGLDRIIVNDNTVLEARDEPILFNLLQSLRDEAHRFAITGHRKKQVKKMTKTTLTEIPNVGAKTRQALLTYFGSIQSLALATIDDLQKVSGIGKMLARQIYSHFHHE